MQTASNVLDVTSLPPREKHTTIFSRFDALNEGEQLTLYNDHDPKPLYFELRQLKGDVFQWDYIEKGPVGWKVNITRKKQEQHAETIGEMVAKDFNKARVFKKYGLDFCCGGKKTLAEACQKKGIDAAIVANELNKCWATGSSGRPLHYDQWGPGFLADYIVNTHHRYVSTVLPDLTGYAARTAKVHGEEHPELIEMNELVQQTATEMKSHMAKEEKVLFPYIKALEAAGASSAAEEAHFGTVKNPIQMMEMEHELVGENLEKIRTLSDNYRLPIDACATYTVLYKMLEDFEEDLHVHVHLENNILFPKAIALETSASDKALACSIN